MTPLFLTSQRLLTQHWPTVAALIEPVMEAAHGEFTVADLEDLCRDGRALALLLSGDDGAPRLGVVMEWRHYPRFSALNIVAMGGRDMHDLPASTFWRTFRLWAAESGVSHIEACVSPAMARHLRPLGFERAYELVRTATCH